MSSYRSRLVAAWGLAPWLVAFPVYRLAVQVHKQIALPRFLGLLELAVLGLGLAALVVALHRPGPRLARWGGPIAFALVVGNLALTGLAVHYNDAALAPRPVAAIAAALSVVLLVAFVRKAREEQAQTLRVFQVAGLAVAAAIGLTSPYVLSAAWADRPRNAASVTPPPSTPVRAGAPKRIVLVTFDELRRRSTTLADPLRDTTPTLAALAAQATRFTNCHSAGDQTIVSMPTVLSGIRPPEVFAPVRNEMSVLREGSISGVAGFLKAAGYRTGYSTMLIQPRVFGMRDEYDDGWAVAPRLDNAFNGRAFAPVAEVVREVVPRRFQRRRTSSMPADVHPIYSVVEQGLALYHAPAEHSFLWVHMGLPHHPYYRIPKADFDKVIKPASYPRVHPFDNGHMDDPAFYETVYDDYLRFSDAMLGKLIAGMQASPEWKDTLLIVTSDHGTRLVPTLPGPYAVGEAPEDITHVPLLIHRPGQTTTARVDAAVRHEDIVPTILSQVYPAVPAGFKGASLLDAPLPGDRIAYTWAVPPALARTPVSANRRTLAAYQGRYKLVLDRPADTARLVDWQKDPDGHHDLSAAHPELAARLKAWLTRELSPS